MSTGFTPNSEKRGDHDLDPAIKNLFVRHEGEVDTRDFAERLDSRLATVKRRRRTRPAVRRLVLAGLAVVVLAGAGVGVWQGLEHLDDQRAGLLFGDQTEVTEGYVTSTVVGTASAGYTGGSVSSAGTFSIDSPSSVTQIKFDEVWRSAAAHFAIDPTVARLGSFNASWGVDGLLSGFNLDATTPDGRMLALYAGGSPGPEGASSTTLTFTASLTTSVGGSLGSPMAPALMVDDLLGVIDIVGLAEIAAQTGLEVDGDPKELYETYVRESGLGPDPAEPTSPNGGAAFADNEVGAVRWTLSGVYSWTTEAKQVADIVKFQLPAPQVLSVSGGRLSSIDGSAVAPSLLPAASLNLGRMWVMVDKASGLECGGTGGGPEAIVLLSGLSASVPIAGTVEAQPADATLNGLAFATSENEVRRIENGVAKTVWAGETEYYGGSCSYGVAYSAGDSSLLYAGSIIKVTLGGSGQPFEALVGREPNIGGGSSGGGSDYNGESWSYESTGQAAVMAVPAGGGEAPRELLRRELLPGLNNVHYDEANNTVWWSTFVGNLGPTSLWRAHPNDAEPEKVELAHDFGGDFALSPDGSTVFYVGTLAAPARVSLRTGEADVSLSSRLATAYMPVFSPDGSKVCLVGAEQNGAPSSLWLYDLAEDSWRKLETTQGLAPTYPAFSPDGQRIAFRNWALGDIWTVTVDAGQLTRYDLAAAEAAIAW